MAGLELLVAERYRLASQIGSGGMGRVWLARDETLHRDVAVKEVVLPEGLTEVERTELCDRMLREARAAGRLNHPNVVQVYDVVQFEGRPWIVMEFVRSRSLYQVIKQDGPVSPKRAAEIGLAVLAALRAAHAAGVWHRDVKPGNVLLADDGRVVLTDFGLATFDGDGAVTRSGLILGSAQYISPERARDGVSGPQSDLWSLGATLYAAVEGRSPYARDSSMATLTALATAPPDTPRRAGPLRGVLIGLLRKNPRHRLSIAQAEKELRRVVDGDVRGRGRLLAPRPRSGDLARSASTDEVGVDQAGGGDASVARGAATGIAPAPPGAKPQPRGQLAHPGTATEETFRVPNRRRRRWPWAVGVAALALAIPVGVVAATDKRGAPTVSPTSSVTPNPTAPPVVTPAMQVQACLAAAPTMGQPVTGPTEVGNFGALDDWAFHQEPAAGRAPAYHVAAPLSWRTWSDGPMVCFREPSSQMAAVVIRQGQRAGDLGDLLRAGIADWQVAAGIDGYTELSFHGDSAPAELEYTYQAKDQRMRGVVWLFRWADQVYLLAWTSPQYRWKPDSALALAFLANFGIDP